MVGIVVPCFNEGEVLGITIPRLLSLIEDLIKYSQGASNSFIVLIDDGSTDDTWSLIEEAVKRFPRRIHGIRLACNAGHQAALLSGLDYVTELCDIAISVDADLQDDLTAISRMIHEYRGGAEIVLGVRESREVDTWFKRNTALCFYKLMKLMGVNLVENHADFRLMSSRALHHLRQFSEANLFLRGLPFLLHRKITTIEYKRSERVAGKSKYPLWKMLTLAWNGITSFSVMPLRLISIIGGGIFLISSVIAVNALIGFVSNKTVPGWTSILIPLYLLGGLIMLSLGIIGEYIAKIFTEVKRRPRFIIDTVVTGECDE
jgi:glycosyltransferase involved in cell wall biosynthesis